MHFRRPVCSVVSSLHCLLFTELCLVTSVKYQLLPILTTLVLRLKTNINFSEKSSWITTTRPQSQSKPAKRSAKTTQSKMLKRITTTRSEPSISPTKTKPPSSSKTKSDSKSPQPKTNVFSSESIFDSSPSYSSSISSNNSINPSFHIPVCLV